MQSIGWDCWFVEILKKQLLSEKKSMKHLRIKGQVKFLSHQSCSSISALFLSFQVYLFLICAMFLMRTTSRTFLANNKQCRLLNENIFTFHFPEFFSRLRKQWQSDKSKQCTLNCLPRKISVLVFWSVPDAMFHLNSSSRWLLDEKKHYQHFAS